MNEKDFLKGYFFAVFMLYNKQIYHSCNDYRDKMNQEKFSNKIDSLSNTISLFTRDGGKMMIAINRGICPVGGNVPFCHTNLEESSFDIVEFWTTPKTWELIRGIFDVQYNEVRVTFNALTHIIVTLGGLDIDAMNNYILGVTFE